MSTFINHTNHPSKMWSPGQTAEAKQYGDIVDMPFPEIDPEADTEAVKAMARKNLEMIRRIDPQAVLCQGESVYSFALVTLLKECGIKTIAACSRREVKESAGEEGTIHKTAVFRFVRFREY